MQPNWRRLIGELFANESRRVELGQHALKVIHQNLGAVERTVDMIVKHLEGGEMYVAPKQNQLKVGMTKGE